ncbi:hypothetical protein [Streptomyces sp. NPDC005731]|uniref:hypothetical protein n=1 Tax=Streptomyces sp. NPDC005731 TaxID=3157056 RepID=UPI0033F418EE
MAAELAGDVLSRGALEAVVRLPEWQLRAMSFLGDVSLDIGGVEFRFTDIPVLDFIMSWRFGLEELTLRGAVRIELLEGQGHVPLSLADPTVTIAWDGRSASCSFVELLRAILSFAQSVLDDLTRANPHLLVNDFMEGLHRGVGMRITEGNSSCATAQP